MTETCDPVNPVQFITDANLERAKHSDSKELMEMVNRLEENEMKPEKLTGDAGFVTGKNILKCREKGIDLEGPVAGFSQDIEKYSQVDHPFDITNFNVTIDDVTQEITINSCPKGKSPSDQCRSDRTGKVLVHFSSDTCSECSEKSRCPIKIGKRISTLTIDEAQYEGAKRQKEFMENSDYRKSYSIRSGSESLVNEVANGHGCRSSNHKGEKRSRLQLIFGSLGCNVKRFIRYVSNSVQNQEQMIWKS